MGGAHNLDALFFSSFRRLHFRHKHPRDWKPLHGIEPILARDVQVITWLPAQKRFQKFDCPLAVKDT